MKATDYKAEPTEGALTDKLRANPPKILSPREAAYALGICERNLQNLTKRGVLPRIKLGRRVIYRWEQIERALIKLEGRG